jgi:uncharacterized FlaG/YvyC family protein
MAAIAAGESITRMDSGKVYSDSEMLENLVNEANRSLEKLATVGLRLDQVWEKESVEVTNVQTDALIRLLPGEEMEDLAQRVRALEGFLLDAHR